MRPDQDAWMNQYLDFVIDLVEGKDPQDEDNQSLHEKLLQENADYRNLFSSYQSTVQSEKMLVARDKFNAIANSDSGDFVANLKLTGLLLRHLPTILKSKSMEGKIANIAFSANCQPA